MCAHRSVSKVFPSQETIEGGGVTVRRSIGTRHATHVDPFLMLDEIRSLAANSQAGFPDHPHRGQATLSYVLKGGIRHWDSKGHAGVLNPGDVQWMNAGRGIIHSEMPITKDGMLEGFQLWINLRSFQKKEESSYQDYTAAQIPVVERDGSRVVVIAGSWNGVEGPIRTHIPMQFLDVKVHSSSVFDIDIPLGHNVFAYVFKGSGIFGGSSEGSASAKDGECVVFDENGTSLSVTGGNDGIRFLFIAGEAIREPIARGGPFVMNTDEEIHQAFHDFRAGTLDK